MSKRKCIGNSRSPCCVTKDIVLEIAVCTKVKGVFTLFSLK